MTYTAEKPALFLLHGWGMNASVWSGIESRLSEHHRLVFFELPGHGHHPHQDAFDLDTAVQLALEAAPAQAAWLGWSLGGTIALQAALQHPQRITDLLLVASSPCFTRRHDWPHAVEARVLEQFHAALQQDFDHTLQRFLGLQVRGSEHARETLRQLRADLLTGPAPRAQALQCGLHILRDTDLRSRLAQLHMPVHFIGGDRDTLVPMEAALVSARQMSNGRVHPVAGAGHAPFISHPEAFSVILQQCLAAACNENNHSVNTHE